MPKLNYFTPSEQACFAKLNQEHTYRNRHDITLNDDVLILPIEYLAVMAKRCPPALYESLERRPLHQPTEFLVEAQPGIPCLRFFDLTAAVIHEKNMSEATTGVLAPDEHGKVTLPMELIVKANFREAKPKGKLIAWPFEKHDTFGVWIPAFYEKATAKKKD